MEKNIIKDTTKKLTLIESLWSLVALIQQNWLIILPMGVGGTIMSAAVWFTDWLNAAGPIAWVLAFFVGAVLVLLLYWLGVTIVGRQRVNRSLEATVSRGINPMETRFFRRQIPLFEFFDHNYRPLKSKEFSQCELYGPSVILLSNGSSLTNSVYTCCSTVLIRDDKNIALNGGAINFDGCTIHNCQITNVILLVFETQYRALSEKQRSNYPQLLTYMKGET